jgi:hypothetical protein
LDQVGFGRSAILLLEGEAGIGKTTLLSAHQCPPSARSFCGVRLTSTSGRVLSVLRGGLPECWARTVQ